MSKPIAFLITPFSAKTAGGEYPPTFAAVQEAVRRAADAAGVDLRRADDIFKSGVIIEQVQEAIDASDVIIAICTGRNANVFYELGYAEARGHEPIFVAATVKSLPSDVLHKRTHLYGLWAKDIPAFEEALVRAIGETLAAKSTVKPRAGRPATSGMSRETPPDLEITIPRLAAPSDDRVIFDIRNLGPYDLDQVTVHQPDTDDRITYPIALVGEGEWRSSIDAGPLRLNHRVQITLCCGSAAELPIFRLRIECQAGAEQWLVARTLPTVRDIDPTTTVW